MSCRMRICFFLEFRHYLNKWRWTAWISRQFLQSDHIAIKLIRSSRCIIYAEAKIYPDFLIITCSCADNNYCCVDSKSPSQNFIWETLCILSHKWLLLFAHLSNVFKLTICWGLTAWRLVVMNFSSRELWKYVSLLHNWFWVWILKFDCSWRSLLW